MEIKILNRWSGAVMFTEEAESLRDAVIRLVANRAYLRDAYLRDAYLRDADLRDADLRGADLRDADLRGADLRGADLRDAYLRDAYLRDADLSGAYLRGADLRGAYLSDADLRDAYNVNKEGAIEGELAPEDYAKRMLEFRERNPDVPVVPLLDATVCKIVNSGEGELKMNDWHSCETTHCRAGWAIHLAGKAGYELEEKYGPERAGAMIYKASTGRYPDFFASDEEALADICAWGSKETESAAV